MRGARLLQRLDRCLSFLALSNALFFFRCEENVTLLFERSPFFSGFSLGFIQRLLMLSCRILKVGAIGLAFLLKLLTKRRLLCFRVAQELLVDLGFVRQLDAQGV